MAVSTQIRAASIYNERAFLIDIVMRRAGRKFSRRGWRSPVPRPSIHGSCTMRRGCSARSARRVRSGDLRNCASTVSSSLPGFNTPVSQCRDLRSNRCSNFLVKQSAPGAFSCIYATRLLFRFAVVKVQKNFRRRQARREFEKIKRMAVKWQARGRCVIERRGFLLAKVRYHLHLRSCD